MGKTAFLLSVLIIGLVAQSSLCSQRRQQSTWNNDETELNKKPSTFRAGQQYTFEYNGQVASGLVEQKESTTTNTDENIENETVEQKQQNAVLRIHSKAKITFNTDERAVLHLEQTHFGKINDAIIDPTRVQPLRVFKQSTIDEKKQRELQLPCEFIYVDGIVERINFHPEDKTWSKNIKRAVLNLIQVNMNRKNQQSLETSLEQESNEMRSTYTVPEVKKKKFYFALIKKKKLQITIEGNCLTSYTVNENDNENDDDDDNKLNRNFRVIKSINFNKCRQVSDIAFGFQGQDDVSATCIRLNAQQKLNIKDEQIPFVNEQFCDPKEVNKLN